MYMEADIYEEFMLRKSGKKCNSTPLAPGWHLWRKTTGSLVVMDEGGKLSLGAHGQRGLL